MWLLIVCGCCSIQTLPEQITQEISDALREGEAPPTVFAAVKRHLYQHLHDMYTSDFSKRCVLAGLYVYNYTCILYHACIQLLVAGLSPTQGSLVFF